MPRLRKTCCRRSGGAGLRALAAYVRPWGKAGGKPRYRCTSCRKTFNPLTGTPLAGLHHQDRWPDQAQALIAGETVAKAAERCKVAYTTA